MIPVSLTFKGVNSYIKEHRIQFDKLLEGHLFGIFGPVGSGKSTILDAIALAIYGDMDRLNKSGDNRNYNLMNLQSNELLIDFEFQSGNPPSFFRCVYKAKRNAKDFEKIGKAEHLYYIKEAESYIPCEQEVIEKAIGLSYENFRRAVIIPQGKFQEFLQLGPTDRTKMMQDIFGLDKFDLNEKAKQLRNKNELKKKEIEGGLNQYKHLEQEQLHTLKGDIQDLEAQLLFAEKKSLQFGNIAMEIEEIGKQQSRFQSLEKETNHLLDSLKDKQIQLEKDQKAFDAIRTAFLGIDQTRKQIEDLQKLCDFKSTQQEQAAILEKLNVHKLQWEKSQKEKQVQESLLDDIEKRIQEINAKKTDLSLLLELDQWFKKSNQLKSTLEEKSQEFNGELEKIQSIRAEIGVSANGQQYSFKEIGDGLEISRKNQIELKVQMQEVENQLQSEKTKAQLIQWAHDLTAGAPCPLCGSTEHPDKLNDDTLNAHLVIIEEKHKALSDRMQDWQSAERYLEKLQEKVLFHEQQAKKLENSLNKTKKALKDWELKFPESEFEITDENAVQGALKEQQQLEKERQKADEKRSGLQKVLNQIMEKLEETNQNIQDLANHHARLVSKNDTLKGLIQQELFAEFESHTAEALKKKMNLLNQEVDRIRSAHQDAEKKLNELSNSISTIKGKLEINQSSLQALKLEIQQQQETIENLVLASGDEWLLKWKTTQNNSEFQAHWKSIKAEVEDGKKRLTTLKFQFESIQSGLEKKSRLMEQLEAIILRGNNLQTLLDLFRGNGFVEYISSVYLSELCQMANERFFKLSQQQLKLELGEKNQFLVRDLLNNGKTRSVKTLSGGQLFQASLSLALALAEHVRQKNGQSQQFFFIDEGFGTQDDYSLDLIMKTLKSLRKEGRYVGVISHVTSMKDEMDCYLSIRKDEVAGSEILNSWEG